MGVEFSFEDFKRLVQSVGLNLSDRTLLILLILFLAQAVGLIALCVRFLLTLWKIAIQISSRLRYDSDTRDFVRVRNLFADHLISEVKRLNREADWDDFLYTDLEAEVEVDPFQDLDRRGSNLLVALLRSAPTILRSFLHRRSSVKERNLVRAIRRSHARAFLLIGDPGSGKTVSLRHFFLETASACAASKNKHAIVPLYMNLKRLGISPDEITADQIYQWVVHELRAGQARTIHDFLDRNFESMLDRGEFFFLFDSFDEIPAVMDAHEEEQTVRQYAEALDRFLHAPHGCRGLIASRPYRSPKVLNAQRMTILPLSNRRMEKALRKYLSQQRNLATQLWDELVRSRDDLLYIARTPFYLNLLAGYAKARGRLPDRQYDLFEHFVQMRAQTDETRLRAFRLTPSELIERASVLAFTMTGTPEIGLEASQAELQNILQSSVYSEDWSEEQLKNLIDALCFSKLARMQQVEANNAPIFGFVHRRFHEFFCTSFLRMHPLIAPLENIVADNRWREVLVLLCEVLPVEQLAPVFATSRAALVSGISAPRESHEQRRAVEALRFLRDAFRSRLSDLPAHVRKECSTFIKNQLEKGDSLDQKRAIESLIVADETTVPALLERALRSDSEWLRQASIRACRILKSLSPEVAKAIRVYLYQRYLQLKIYQDFRSYSVVFSYSPSLNSLRVFTNLLVLVFIVEVVLFCSVFVYGIFIMSAPLIAVAISPLLLFYLSRILGIGIEYRLKNSSKNPFDVFDKVVGRYAMKSYRRSKTNQQSLADGHADFVFDRLYDYRLPSWSFIFIMMLQIVILSYVFTSEEANEFLNRDFQTSLAIVVVFSYVNAIIRSFTVEFPGGFFDIVKRLVIIMIQGPKIAFSLLVSILDIVRNMPLLLFMITFFQVWIFAALRVFKSGNYSIEGVYQTHGLIVLVLVILPMPLLVLFMAPLFIMTISIMIGIIGIVHDQYRLIILTVRPNNRPKSAKEAVFILQSFRSEAGKAQFVRALQRWLPIETDWYTLAQTARQQKGEVRDALFQLVEMWQDSLPEQARDTSVIEHTTSAAHTSQDELLT